MAYLHRLAGLLLLGGLAAGCASSTGPGGTAKGPAVEDHLREVGTMLTLLSGETRRGYGNPADLARYEQGCPFGYQAVKSGAVVVVPGATMPGEGEATGTEAVIAYEKDVPTKGGYVLLHNGKVKQMTADEFRSAPKAKG